MTSSSFAIIAVMVLVPLLGFSNTAKVSDQADIVHQFIRAFNSQDVDGMSALVTDDIRWIYINRSSMSVELEGKEALTQSMSEYFTSCPSCRSEIHRMVCSTERVSVVEVASWDSRDGPKSQASMAVYEFQGELIQTVYYFPEESTYPVRGSASTCHD